MSYSAPPPPPPGGGYGPPPPGGNYGQPAPYGGGMPAPKTSVMAIISLISSIIGIPCCGCFVFGVIGAVLGYLAKNEIAQSNGSKTGEGLAKWGLILGVVGVALGILAWILSATGLIPSNFQYSTNFNG